MHSLGVGVYRSQFIIALLVITGISTTGFAGPVTDDQIRQLIIKDSIATYPGHCPCPYTLASTGSQCGRRSAWSKGGGYSPLCYPNDINDDMVKEYRQRGLGQ
jgi:hypothetical protein